MFSLFFKFIGSFDVEKMYTFFVLSFSHAKIPSVIT